MMEASQATGWLLLLVRTAACLGTLPGFGHRVVPRTVKVGMVVGLTIVLWRPELGSPPLAASGWLGLTLCVVQELLVGLALGFCFGIVLEPVRVAGAYIEDQIGLSLGSVADPASGNATTVIGQLLEIFALVTFFVLDAHHLALRALVRSCEVLDLGSGVTSRMMANVVREGTLIPTLGMMLAFPLALMLFVITIFSGILNRAAPQFSFFSVSFTLRILLGLAGLAVAFPEMLGMTARMILNVGDVVQRVFST